MARADSAFKLLKRGMDAADRGDTLAAQIHLEQAVNLSREPLACSYLAYCRAAEENEYPAAIELCREAISQEPDNALHYLNLGRIFRRMGMIDDAIQTLYLGLNIHRHPLILNELRDLGIRRPPLFPALGRSHPVNRILGRTLAWVRPGATPE